MESQNGNLVALVDRGIELSPAKIFNVGGFDHIDKGKQCTMFTPPGLPQVDVTTLCGLVDLLAISIDSVSLADIFIHVDDHTTVYVLSKAQDVYGRRRRFVRSTLSETKGFPYNTFIDQEAFNIGLRAQFVPDDSLAALLGITGNLAKQSEARQEDDGVTQRVTVKSGIALMKDTTPPSRVTLAPFRTFREAVQPASDFVFRVRCTDNGNQCALFEADGGFWKIAAMKNVKEWLENRLKGASAELGAIPVIS